MTRYRCCKILADCAKTQLRRSATKSSFADRASHEPMIRAEASRGNEVAGCRYGTESSHGLLEFCKPWSRPRLWSHRSTACAIVRVDQREVEGMEARILRTLATLGVPGVALGVFYLLLRQFGFQFSTIGPIASASIAILFLLLVAGVTLYALRHFGVAVTSPQPVTGSASRTDQGVPPTQVVEMFRVLLRQVDSEQQNNSTEPPEAGRDPQCLRAIDRQSVGKFLALVLRHKPDAAALKLDAQGWVEAATLIKGVNAAGYSLTSDDLDQIVRTSLGQRGERRFALSHDKKRIRANWGRTFPTSG